MIVVYLTVIIVLLLKSHTAISLLVSHLVEAFTSFGLRVCDRGFNQPPW